jgi:hypothetical protein
MTCQKRFQEHFVNKKEPFRKNGRRMANMVIIVTYETATRGAN